MVELVEMENNVTHVCLSSSHSDHESDSCVEVRNGKRQSKSRRSHSEKR